MTVLHREIEPRVVGLNAMTTEQCWQAAYPATFDILRDRRIGLVALAALDTAVWDAVGKALGQPLWLLWGGARCSVPMMAIGGYYGEPLGPIEDEVVHYRDELGLAGMKFKVGGASPAEDAERAPRRARPAGDGLRAVHRRQPGIHARRGGGALPPAAGQDIRWFEEPVRWHNDRRSLRDVRYARRHSGVRRPKRGLRQPAAAT